jgi:hypothetical protein
MKLFKIEKGGVVRYIPGVRKALEKAIMKDFSGSESRKRQFDRNKDKTRRATCSYKGYKTEFFQGKAFERRVLS